MLIDITAVKRLEAELRDADRHKDEFLATLAHELRNPLAPIRNAVGILRHSGSADANTIKAGAMIERQVKVMARLIDDLMDVARINQGRLELRLAEVSLQDVINLALEASRPQIDEGRHRLTVALPEQPVLLLADLTRLAQVFTNILTNASKYTECGGSIALRAEADASAVCVTVQDNGIGIAQENIGRVFEMFSQVEVALARSRGGLGIGLSLAKRLVELHGGGVVAASEGLGRGSEFKVTLPISRAIVKAAADGKPVQSTSSAGLSILVVDDNIDGAESLAALLEIHGFRVKLAYDGPSAVEAAESFRPQIVLLDIGLPGMNGYEVCKSIRAMPWARACSFIAITGWGDPRAVQLASEAGFDRHFVKPVTEEQLISAIDELASPGPVVRGS